MKILTVILTTIFIALVSAHLLLPSESSVDDFSNAVITILRRHFTSNHSSTMITRCSQVDVRTKNLQSDILDRILFATSHEIAYIFSNLSRPRRPRFFNILLFDSYLAFSVILGQLHPDKYDYSGYYLMILTAPQAIDTQTLQKMFSDLWTSNIVNVVLVMTNHKKYDDSRETLLYTYFPYVENECEHAHPVLLHRLSPFTTLHSSVELYPPKLSNFHGCPIRIAAFDYPPYTILESDGSNPRKLRGMEGDMLQMISTVLNFTIELVEVNGLDRWGEIYANGSFSGAVKLVIDGAVNMTVGSFSMRDERMSLMKSSVSYYTIKLMFAVPPGRPYTAFEKLFRPFSVTTWALVSVYMALGFGVIFLLKFYPEEVRSFIYGSGTGMALMNLVNVFFGGAMIRTPGRNFARTLLFFWLYYCFVMRSLYQGSLFEYLQQSKNFSHVNSLRRIEAEGMPYWMSQGSTMFVRDLPRIMQRYVELNFFELYHRKMACFRTTIIPDDNSHRFEVFRKQSLHQLNVAVLTTFDHVAAYNEKYYKRGIVHLARDVLQWAPICLYYPKKSCLAERFDREIIQIQRAGLIEHWLHEYIGYRFFRRAKIHHHSPEVMTNEHLMGCYEALSVLLVMACGLFALERLAGWVKWLGRVFDFLVQ